jgi:hypothetical protein
MLVYRRELISRKQSGCGDQGEILAAGGYSGGIGSGIALGALVVTAASRLWRTTERNEGVRHRRWLLPAGAIAVGDSDAGDVALDRGTRSRVRIIPRDPRRMGMPDGSRHRTPTPCIWDAAPRWAPTPIRSSARRFCATRAASSVGWIRRAPAARACRVGGRAVGGRSDGSDQKGRVHCTPGVMPQKERPAPRTRRRSGPRCR